MAGRPGFFGGPRGFGGVGRDEPDEAWPEPMPLYPIEPAPIGVDGLIGGNGLIGGSPTIGGDPLIGAGGLIGGGPLIGAGPFIGVAPSAVDQWATSTPAPIEAAGLTGIELFGVGFRVSGQVNTGQFDRFSDWMAMQSGLVRIQNALQLAQAPSGDRTDRADTLWIRLDSAVLVAERSAAQAHRNDSRVIPKQARGVTIMTPGYLLRGHIHLHAYGSLEQFLEIVEPAFLPLTDAAVESLTERGVVSQFSFAMVNRRQIVTVLSDDEEPAPPAAPSGPLSSRTFDSRW